MKLKLSIFNRPLELPPQLEWKFGHEPELLAWTIRARNYNTTIANGICVFMTPIILGLTYISYSVEIAMEPLRKLSLCILFMTLMFFGLIGTTHQTMKFAYRFTKSGLEYCKWKDFPKWAATLLKWLTPLTLILFLFLATIDINFLIGALIGPGGMALTYLAMVNSKEFRELHTEYHHHEFKWTEFVQLAIATNREVVDLQYRLDLEDYKGVWNINIFCKPKQKEMIADFIRPYLSPDTPVIRARVEVPLSTDD